MKRHLREAALKKMERMMELAVATNRDDPALAQRYASLARMVSTKHRVRMPPGMRLMFCRKCKGFSPPGSGSRVRLGGASPRAVRTTCLRCGHMRRRVLGGNGSEAPFTP